MSKTTKATVTVSGNNGLGFWGVFVLLDGWLHLVAKCETEERALALVPVVEKMAWT